MKVQFFSVTCLIVVVLVSGCAKKNVIKFCSPDKTQCVTVIDDRGEEIRYVIPGEYSEIPGHNFIKLDVMEVDPLGDSFHICWRSGQYEWVAVMNGAKIVESTLDTTKFNFSTSLPEDERGIPTEIIFRNENCAVFDFYDMRLSPNKGATVEID